METNDKILYEDNLIHSKEIPKIQIVFPRCTIITVNLFLVQNFFYPVCIWLLYVSLSYKDKKENTNQTGLYKSNPQEFAVNEILLVVSDYNICTRATFPIFT